MAKDMEQEWKGIVRQVGERNRKLVEAFLVGRKSKGGKSGSLVTEAKVLLRLDQDIGKPFGELDQADIETWLANLTNKVSGNSLTPSTKKLYRVVVKVFFRTTLKARFKELDMAEWLKAGTVEDELTQDDMITPDEARAIMDQAHSPRDRAMMHVLYETGMRVSEFLSLTIGSFRPNGDGWAKLVMPKGAKGLKSGRREVPIVESLPALQRWLEVHPHRDDSNAALWAVTRGDTRQAMSVDTFREMLQNAAARAKVSKAINPHNWRHSAATNLAKRPGWNEPKLRAFFGWKPGSPMPSRYVHLAGADVDNQVLSDNGMAKEDKPKVNPLAPQVCPHCQERNTPQATLCTKCGRPLSLDAAMEIAQEAEDRIAAMVEAKMAAMLESLSLARGGKDAQQFRRAVNAIKAATPRGKPIPGAENVPADFVESEHKDGD